MATKINFVGLKQTKIRLTDSLFRWNSFIGRGLTVQRYQSRSNMGGSQQNIGRGRVTRLFSIIK